MKDNKVWDLVDLPPNGKTIGSKWLFKKKTDMDGVIHTFKARLVAKGFTQTYEVDYEETFSPVANIRAIRILIAITAFYDYKIWQMDVKNAFLNGHLSEEVYMVQPKSLVNPKYHASSSISFMDLSKYLGNGINNLMMKLRSSVSGNNIPMLQDVKSYLGRCFAMKDLGEENSKCGTIPMHEKLKLSKSQGASTPAEKQRMQNVLYASIVGSIMYATTVKNILKYLRNTKDMFLVYGGDVDWKSTKQSIFATSSTDTKYITAFDASKEAVWIRKFISELGVVPTIEEPISMYFDNTGAIAIAKDHGITKGVRHFCAKVHYLCETIEWVM
ncbi:retrotransposon protein, putative, ty1-copia subclass [Tanacetum coccineum]